MASFATFGNELYSGKRSFDIVGRRKVWYAVSAGLILLSLVGLFGRGLNFGIEFRGGTELRVGSVTQLEDYENRAVGVVRGTQPDAEAVTVTQIGDSTVRIQTGELDNTEAEDLRTALSEEFGVPVAEVTSSFIGPSWGQTVTTKAIQALVAFLLLVSLVLAVYFRTWKMAAAALVALLHDVLFTVGVYALLGIEVSPASMIGFLTILGYSIYDTIVVFDKVRENTEQALDTRRMSYADAANLAVNQTLVRSINTSVVALLPVLTILIAGLAFIGPGTLLDLAIALFIGIAVGTFSSVFIATPLLVHLRENEPEIKDLAKRSNRHRRSGAAEHSTGAEALQGGLVEQDAVLGDQAYAGGAEAGDGAVSPGRVVAPGRQVHPYAQRGPRNQPKRRSRRS